MNALLTLIPIILSVLQGIEHFVGKRLVTGEEKKLSETEGKTLARVARTILGLFLLGAILFSFSLNMQYEFLRNVLVFAFIVGYGIKAVMEWKYLEGTKHVATVTFMCLSVAAVLGSFHLIYERNLTTYGAVMAEVIDQEETVKSINIETLDQSSSIETEDERLIAEILSDPAEMVLFETSPVPLGSYHLTVHTENNQFQFYIGDDSLVKREFGTLIEYEILKDNELYRLIKSELEK
ncbi:DUF4181 domain-containing protein [Salipaludibacillus aurantiacus]|uniref:DUF4181 domain-containing protein n=1 Tax=Salipaludibacillus aurantiacus TaxID=1601833 RepID=A0A1H9URG8_9BACI|nr:DUF4181 domain-containing protein [Salipaludibacillus aurantiacus]SES11992.1 protein of unknown function [Salipaludibacillus aurantiacus]